MGFDPLLIAIVDAALGRHDCTARYQACAVFIASPTCLCSEEGAWKLGNRFALEDGSPLIGIVLAS